MLRKREVVPPPQLSVSPKRAGPGNARGAQSPNPELLILEVPENLKVLGGTSVAYCGRGFVAYCDLAFFSASEGYPAWLMWLIDRWFIAASGV